MTSEIIHVKLIEVYYNAVSISTLIASIGESSRWSFWHSMATNWSIMAARAQIEQVKLEEFNFKGIKSKED